MSLNEDLDSASEKDSIFQDILRECRPADSSTRLSLDLKRRLEKFPPDARRDIVNRSKQGWSPLLLSCRKGQQEVVEYLIQTCHADIEQKGTYKNEINGPSPVVTPLGCAAVSNRLAVVQILLKHGADVNAESDTGSTPVRSACSRGFFKVVKCLVEHGADINKPNYEGVTCLHSSVQHASICEFLLQQGANVNATNLHNLSALHYALKARQLKTTQLLVEHGADLNAKSDCGDDALQMACLGGDVLIFNYLLDYICDNVGAIPREKRADSYELLGTSLMDPSYNEGENLLAGVYWLKATQYRIEHSLFPKKPIMDLQEAYGFQKEFDTLGEAIAYLTQRQLIMIQTHIVTERILGPHHEVTISRLMCRGELIMQNQNLSSQLCINLWRHALELRIEKDSILSGSTCGQAEALVPLMVSYYRKIPPENEGDVKQRFHDVVSIFKALSQDLIDKGPGLNVRPVFERQLELYSRILKCVTHLIYLMVKISPTNQNQQVAQLIRDLLRNHVRCFRTNNTLLHFCMSKGNIIRSDLFVGENIIMVFPNEDVVRMLLQCGADPNAKNFDSVTPLHYASHESKWLVKLLMQYGGHIDVPNVKGISPLDYFMSNKKFNAVDINVSDYINLKCLCAKVITTTRLAYKGQVPASLENFVKLHDPYESARRK